MLWNCGRTASWECCLSLVGILGIYNKRVYKHQKENSIAKVVAMLITLVVVVVIYVSDVPHQAVHTKCRQFPLAGYAFSINLEQATTFKT